MICTNCGSIIDVKQSTCSVCGLRVVASRQVSKTATPGTAQALNRNPTAQVQSQYRITCNTCSHSEIAAQALTTCPHCNEPLTARDIQPIQISSPQPANIISGNSSGPVKPAPRHYAPQSPWATATAGSTVLGNIVTRREAAAEAPDPDLAGILFILLAVIDLLLLGIGIFFLVVTVVVIMIVIAVIFRNGGLVGRFLPFLVRPFMSLFRPVFGAVFSRDNGLVPVNYYIVDGQRGRQDFRLKGVLINDVIDVGDQIAVWGPRRRGIVQFQRGFKFMNGQVRRLQRPFNWSWLRLGVLVILNLTVLCWYVAQNP